MYVTRGCVFYNRVRFFVNSANFKGTPSGESSQMGLLGVFKRFERLKLTLACLFSGLSVPRYVAVASAACLNDCGQVFFFS